jgi:CheY-like chemotaxis protein
MEKKIKVVCPKCQAKLNLAVEKMKCEVVKFRCPGCSSVLRARKPDKDQPDKQKAVQAEKIQQPVTSEKKAGSGDLRKHKRVKFKKKVLVNNQIMVEALDISENGLFLHTGRSFDDGATVQVGIPTLPGSFDLVVQATVQHNHRGIGMGLQFVDVDGPQKVKLQKLVSSLDESARKALEGRKIILLAGGSDTARNIYKSKLVLDGFYVLQATNADEVFGILQNETPDAMVLDWQETSFYSKGLLTQIRQTPQYDNVIIIVLAALTDTSAQREILDTGADRYMAKMDTNPAKLSLILKEIIAGRDS